jgi:hypothetical protein
MALDDFVSPVNPPGPPNLNGGFSFPCCVIPSTNLYPLGHLGSFFFEPHDHLVFCPTDFVNHNLDLIDQHFPIWSPICPKRRVFDLESLEHIVFDLDSFERDSRNRMS